MKTLIIVDVQEDFYSPTGKLSVPGGDRVVEEIKKLIENDRSIRQVIFTVDWHTPEDCSFKENGGPWNPHCIQYSPGASIHQDLLQAVHERGFKSVDGKEGDITKRFLIDTYDIFIKGEIPTVEEYGAFYNSEMVDDEIIGFSNINEDSWAYINSDNDIIICGLAGDFCVKESIENLCDIPEIHGKIMIYLPGIASIDGGKTLSEFMSKKKLESYELQ